MSIRIKIQCIQISLLLLVIVSIWYFIRTKSVISNETFVHNLKYGRIADSYLTPKFCDHLCIIVKISNFHAEFKPQINSSQAYTFNPYSVYLAHKLDVLFGFDRSNPIEIRKINFQKILSQLQRSNMKQYSIYRSTNGHLCIKNVWNNQINVCPDSDGSKMGTLDQFISNKKHLKVINPWQMLKFFNYQLINSKCQESFNFSDFKWLNKEIYFNITEITIIDYLLSNKRPFFYLSRRMNEQSFVEHDGFNSGLLDNSFDNKDILSLILNCCLIRNTTKTSLLKLHNSSLFYTKIKSLVADISLADDNLLDQYVLVINRRFSKLIDILKNCLYEL